MQELQMQSTQYVCLVPSVHAQMCTCSSFCTELLLLLLLLLLLMMMMMMHGCCCLSRVPICPAGKPQ
jgi:hypothetical protein